MIVIVELKKTIYRSKAYYMHMCVPDIHLTIAFYLVTTCSALIHHLQYARPAVSTLNLVFLCLYRGGFYCRLFAFLHTLSICVYLQVPGSGRMSARPNPKQLNHMPIYPIKHGWPNGVIPLVGRCAAFHCFLIQTIATPTLVNFWGMAAFHTSRAPGLFSGGVRRLNICFQKCY